MLFFFIKKKEITHECGQTWKENEQAKNYKLQLLLLIWDNDYVIYILCLFCINVSILILNKSKLSLYTNLTRQHISFIHYPMIKSAFSNNITITTLFHYSKPMTSGSIILPHDIQMIYKATIVFIILGTLIIYPLRIQYQTENKSKSFNQHSYDLLLKPETRFVTLCCIASNMSISYM